MNRAHIAHFLRHIPQSNEEPQTIASICNEDNPLAYEGIAYFLLVWGCVQYDAEQQTIQAKSQTAKYALNSLANYVEDNMPIIADWHTRGVNSSPDAFLSNGASFLWALEHKRLQNNPQARPSRYEQVAQVLITRRHHDKLEFLMQYDKNAQQYQFIGGRAKLTDANILATAQREVAEEIQPTLYYEHDYQLIPLVTNMTLSPTLSPTFGALTSYTFTIYHMQKLRKNILLSSLDRWVPLHEIHQGQIQSVLSLSQFSSDTLYQMLETTIEGGLKTLTSSFTPDISP